MRQTLVLAQHPVRYQARVRDDHPATLSPLVPRWWRGPGPDPTEVRRLYLDENRTETEIAVILSISRARVSAVLRDAGIPRRDSGKDCPLDPNTLYEMVKAGTTRAALARELGVSHSTAARWFTEAGIPVSDSMIDTDRLLEL